MEYNIKEVAQRLKGLRMSCDLSVEEFSNLTDISKEDYEKIENGEKDFSVSFLYKCAEIFRVDMVEILTGVYPKLSDYCVVKAERDFLWQDVTDLNTTCLLICSRISVSSQCSCVHLISKKNRAGRLRCHPTKDRSGTTS